jgi:hypothetical protein
MHRSWRNWLRFCVVGSSGKRKTFTSSRRFPWPTKKGDCIVEMIDPEGNIFTDKQDGLADCSNRRTTLKSPMRLVVAQYASH